jgi:hypothetical protein
MANRIQLRRGNTSEWTNANPILAQGEVGIDLDQNRIKIGDGSTPWNSLAYERPDDQSSNIPNTLVKRDQSGNFSANAVTAALVGNSSTASQLANARQISLTGDINGANSFDGSQNMTIVTTLSTQANLSSGTYTKLTVNERGLVTAGQNPTTLGGYNITDGQLENNFLTALSGLHAQSLNGYVVKTNNTTGGSVVREIVGTAGRIQQIGDSTGITGNTIFDLIPTGVSAAYSGASSLYFDAGNTQQSKIFNAPDQESNTTTDTGLRMTVDVWGRITEITEFPIVTAYEGTKAAAYDNAATYLRYAKITAGGRLYEAGYGGVSAGQGAPSHTDGTKTGGWWDLGVAKTPVKGLASFDQEDFDVDSTGHVTIASKGIDNTQLQNPIIGFADGNTIETFELDAEQTATTGYRGFNYLNYLKVNDTSGNPLFAASNAFNTGSGGIDINVNTDNSGDIYFDAAGGGQLLQRTDGSLTVEVNTTTANFEVLQLNSFNGGAGAAWIVAEASSGISLTVQAAGSAGGTTDGKILIEDFRAYDNYLATLSPTLNLDPGDSGDNTGTVRIWGNLTVDGVTTTVNSTVVTIDDPIFTLGGDTAPVADDNKDRGIEFRYYDTQARLGFFGWDENVTRLDGGTGGYSFLYNASNASEVFSGTNAYIKAGALSLTTNTPSSSSTTGTLVVTGGVGVSEDIYIGQNLNVTGTGYFGGQVDVFDTLNVRGSNEAFQVQTGGGSNVFTVDTDNGNTVIEGTLNVNGASTFTDDVTVNIANKFFKIQNGSGVDKFTIDTDNGNTSIQGYIDVEGNIFQQSAPGTGSNSIFSDTSFYSDVILVNNGGTHSFLIKDGANNNKFSVIGSSGNTDIQGTLDVNGATTITNTLSVSNNFVVNTNKFTVASVSGDTAIAGTLAVTGNTTLTGDLTGNAALLIQGNTNLNGSSTTIGNSNTDTLTVPGQVRFTSTDGQTLGGTYSANGSVRISGGVAIDENLAVQNDLYIYGDLNITGNQVINGTTTYNARIDITNTAEADSLGDNNVAFQVDGGGIIRKKLWAGGDFTVYDDVNDRNAFYVDNSNGNTDIYGNLDIRSGNFTVAAASGNVITAGTLTVAGETTINDSLFIDAANELFRIRNGSDSTDRFSVDTDNGNTHVDGTLNVDGAVIMGSTLSLSNNLVINSNRFTVAASTGATSILGTLNVSNNTDITGTLEVDGATTINNTLSLVGGSSNLTVGGNAVIAGNLTVNGTTTTVNSTTVSVDDKNIELGATASPTDASADGGGLTLKGSSDKTFNWVNSTDSWTSSEHIDISVSKSLKHGTAVILSPTKQLTNITDITATGDISFGGGNFTVAASTGNTVVGGTLNVNGTITLTGLSAVTGTFSGAVSSGGNFSVGGTSMTVNAASGNIITQGSLNVNGATTLSSSMSVTGNITTSGDIAVNGADITTTTTGAFNIVNSNATTVNIGGGASSINFGASNSTVTINDDLTITNNLVANGTADFSDVTAVGNVLTVNPGVSRSVNVGTLLSQATLTAYGNVTFGVTTANTGTFTGSIECGTTATVGTTLNVTNGVTAEKYTSTVSTGTAPLTVTSTTLVSNLNADQLDGQEGSYYTNAGNLNAGTVPDARLLTTGVAAGTYGSASAVSQVTVDVKGRVTGAQNANIQIGQSAVTNLTTDLAAKANSASLAAVATSGAYSDLSGTPTISAFGATLIDDADAGTARITLGLGTAATTNSTAYATAAQGAAADSALQAETITLATLKTEVAAATDFADFQTRIAAL